MSEREALTLSEIRPFVIVFVVTAGLMCRLATFQIPLLDHHAWRQADTATMARNFARSGGSPLAPEIDARGERPHGYVATGLELHAIVTGALGRVTGFSVPLARVVSGLCFLGSAFFLMRFLRRRDDPVAQVIALTVYALGLPYVIFAEHAVWNEPLLILLSFALLNFSQDYVHESGWTSLLLAAGTAALLSAVKPQWGIQLALVVGLFWEHDRWRSGRRVGLWVITGAGVASAALMVVHIDHVTALTGLTFGTTDKLFQAEDMTLHYAFVIGRRLVRDIFGPVGLLCVVAGLVALVRAGRRAEILGVAALLAYVITVSRGVRVHDYYLLPVVPLGVIAMPAGVLTVSRWITRAAWRREAVIIGLLWTMIMSSFVRSVSFHSWYEPDADKGQFCEELAPHLQPNDLVAFADYGSPDLLFCLDRRGWLLQAEESTPARLNDLFRRGATVLVLQQQAPVRPDGLPLAMTRGWAAYRVRPDMPFTAAGASWLRKPG